jgi:hypothetical protein
MLCFVANARFQRGRGFDIAKGDVERRFHAAQDRVLERLSPLL